MADEYEDEDFEDYEDEFDQDEDGAGHPAAAAVAKPQAKASAAAVPSARSDSATLVPKRAPYQVAGKVDVAPAKKHFIAPTTNAERSLRTLRAVRRAAVLKAVQLHPVSFTLYDAAPQTLYELLRREMKLRSKRSQARDDDAVVGTQTEDVEEDEQACQAPDDLAAQAKRALTDASASGRTAAALTANKARLSRFLTSASAVVEALCAENALASAGGAGGFGPKSELPLATRSARLALSDPFSGRSPLDVSFSRDASETLVAYGLDGSAAPQGKKKEDQALRRACQGGGLLAVWVMHQPSAPWHVLRALGLPTCCALAAVPCRVAVAGTADGSVQIWDLREPATRHERVRVGGSRVALRSPTFCSDGGGVGRGHLAPVVALSLSEPQAAAETADLIISSLDGAGRLVVWQVMEGDLSLLSVDESADAAAGGFGYGQAVGGRLRLVQTSVVQTCGPALSLAPAKGARGVASGRGGGAGAEGLPERALCLAALPSDPSKFLVGTDGGRLLLVSRYANGAPQPSEFEPPSAASRPAVSCLAFSPTQHDFFLAGRADASVCLYDLSGRRPLLWLEPPSMVPAAQLAWSPTRPCVFFLLDGDATLHAFDLLKPGRTPAHSAPLYSHASYGFGTAGGEVRVRIAIGASSRARRGEVACYLGVAGGGGDVSLHLLQDSIAKPEPNEAFRLHKLLEAL